MSDQTAKQQIIDHLREVENILVTVSRNPSVDELSAALGVTLLLNKIGKHATAVFSGDIPPAITFLDPEKTFENTVDSLRDFIIALDKEKADHLRYKVDGDMVKIFITPYRTTITDKDLDFSQGDYNVEMVLAIGVENEGDLDRALSDHGRIMHDAAVAVISIGDNSSDFGTISWEDVRASSYSELITGLAEGLRSDKGLLDEQIATAFLTGIVAATERFSNQRTTSQSMTVAAELMAAGANQQLIASRLEEADEIPSGTRESSVDDDEAEEPEDTSHFKVDRNSKDEAAEEPVEDEQAADGTMSVSHEKQGDVDEVARQMRREQQEAATAKAEKELAESLATSTSEITDKPTVADLQSDLKAAADEVDQSIAPPSVDDAVLPPPSLPTVQADEPSFGGALNATSEQAAADKRRIEDDDRNKTILSHDGAHYVGHPPVAVPPLNSYGTLAPNDKTVPSADALGEEKPTSRATPVEPPTDSLTSASEEDDDNSNQKPTLADIDQKNRGAAPYQDAQAAVSAALDQTAPAAPSNDDTQDDGGLPPLPPMPDFSTLPPLPSDPSLPPAPQTSEELLSDALGQPATPPLPPIDGTSDPGQFRIPGQ